MSFELNRLRAFKYFAAQIRAGEEGCFFSCDDPLIGQKWAFGFGKKQKYDGLESNPQFSIFSFEGDEAFHFSFDKHFDSEATAVFPEVDLSELEINLALEPMESDHFLSLVKKAQVAQTDGLAWVINGSENFTYKASSSESETLTQLFLNFLNLGKSHCGGVLFTKEQKFCSLSPEVFMSNHHQVIETFPIKGTGDLDYLENSKKEAAELTMITDLMRNDLGKISDKVEVVTERFFREESHFYHAFAHIKGYLKRSLTTDDYRALLPAGSISGAPKKKVVNLIKNLENFDRQFFTGTFGAHFNGTGSVYNILIRTLFSKGAGKYEFPVGVGITIESDPKTEWEELIRKRALLDICSSTQKPLD